MEPRNVICLIVDRLQAAQVGAYGNTWSHTPQLDRLAAESLLLDRALADALDLDRLYRGFWQGLPARLPDAEKHSAGVPGAALPALARAAGMQTVLLTDEPAVAALAEQAGFATHSLLKLAEPTGLAGDVEETQAAEVAAAAGELLAELQPPFFFWLHARGLAGAWDAPYELRRQYADEEDPPPPDFFLPPSRHLPADYDPDELLGISQAYAGQVAAWDTCLGALIEEFRNGPRAADTLLVVASPRGYPLGEHLQIGPGDLALYNEHIQIPWMLHFPDGLGALARSQDLVVPADLAATLAEWLELPAGAFGPTSRSLVPLARGLPHAGRECVILHAGPHDWAVRTPAWHLLVRGPQNERRVELYAKPSDRFEVNDVADRAPEIVAGLVDVLSRAEGDLQAEPAGLDRPLVEELD